MRLKDKARAALIYMARVEPGCPYGHEGDAKALIARGLIVRCGDAEVAGVTVGRYRATPRGERAVAHWYQMRQRRPWINEMVGIWKSWAVTDEWVAAAAAFGRVSNAALARVLTALGDRAAAAEGSVC